ncbi:MAG: hypothetical protein QOK35_2923 [Pseudonocardiales bacterium]|jgi:hypothetical protein|nr:hypothetical protein [Pseudonocardiales bacterium]
MATGVPRRALTACLLAGVLSVVCGCAAGPTPAPPAPAAAPVTTAAAPATAGISDDHGGTTQDGGRRGRGGGDGSDGGGNGRARTAAGLPADFPSDVPLPPGELQAASGSARQWSALLRVPGSASDALRSAMQFYVAAGFTQDSPSTAHRGRYTTTLVTENRDHSPNSTNLVVGIAAR